MRLNQDGTQWGNWQPYSTNATYMFTGSDGLQTIYIQFQDMVGNISNASSDDIILDRAIPAGSILVNNRDTETDNPQVALNLSAQDSPSGVCDMRLRNQGDSWGNWQTFATSVE